MKDGHPYETEEMDRLRSDQRRLLRHLPNEVVTPLAELDASGQFGRDRLEVLVRRRVAVVVAAVDPKVTDLLAKLQAFQDTRDLSNTLTGGMGGSFQVIEAEARQRLGPVIIEAERQYSEAEEGLRDPNAYHEMLAAVSGLAGLLCWADALADDGYRDPRVRQPEA